MGMEGIIRGCRGGGGNEVEGRVLLLSEFGMFSLRGLD